MAQTKVKLISDGVIVQGNLHASHGITTADIGEGSNLYYTDARVGSYLSTNSFATESYVGTQIANLVDSSPSALNTLNELAAALGDDANFSTTVTNSIALKAPLASPTFTGSINGSGIELSNYMQIKVDDAEIYWTNAANNDYWRWKRDASNNFICDHYNGSSTTAALTFNSSQNATFGGNLNTSTVQISNGANYNENIRMFPGSSGYSSLIIGAVSGTSGTGAGQWTLVRYPTPTYSNKFSIRHNSTDVMVMTTGGATTFAGTVETTQITATNGLNYLKRNTDASLQLRSENTRSGLFITKPATDTVMGSALVLADESYRLGTSNYYHMYMLQNGNTYFQQNVGIGTTLPGAKLEVVDGNNYAKLGDLQGNSTMSLRMADNSGFPIEVQAYGTQLRFNTATTTGATPSVKMNILSNGNVGIGETSPEDKLHVSGGNVRIYSTNNANHLILKNNATATSGVFEERIKFLGWNNNENAAIIGMGNAYFGSPVNALAFQVSGAEAMRINHGGSVGIGTTPETGTLLHLEKNSAANTVTELLRLDCGENSHAAGKGGAIVFRDINVYSDTAKIIAQRVGAGSSSTLQFQLRGSEKMRILSSGGITFNGDTSTANALDDYEEGTWTPDVHGSITRGTVSYQYRSGSYTKIGNRVWCRFGFKLSSISGAAGRVRVDGLPFTSRSYGAYQEPNFSVSTGLLATTANAYRARMFVVNSSSYLEGRISVNTDTIWNISDFGGDEWIILAFHYETHI